MLQLSDLFVFCMYKVVDKIVEYMYTMFHNTLAVAITTLREIKCTFYKVILNKKCLSLLFTLKGSS